MAASNYRDSRPDEMAYRLNEEDLPIYVGKGLGDMYYEDAIDLSVIRRKAKGLPANLEFITLGLPLPDKPKKGSKSPSTSRASKNNPYLCPYCPHKTTRRGNMKKHLEKVHNDYNTDPLSLRY